MHEESFEAAKPSGLMSLTGRAVANIFVLHDHFGRRTQITKMDGNALERRRAIGGAANRGRKAHPRASRE